VLNSGCRTLFLLASEVVDASSWRWNLADEEGVVLATQSVELDTRTVEFEALSSLEDFFRLHISPDRRLSQQAAWLDRLGAWVSENVLGNPITQVLHTITETHSVSVSVQFPAAAGFLVSYPLELARIGPTRLPDRRISLQYQPEGARPPRPSGSVPELRLLAIFSSPITRDTLALRRERIKITQLMEDLRIEQNLSIHFRYIQYGVDQHRIREAVADPAGWDIIHMSGHGSGKGFLLERRGGSADAVSDAELADILGLASSRLRLVTLSSCGSARGGSSSGLAETLCSRLGVVAVGMRYSVADEFLVDFSAEFYRQLLSGGSRADRALTLASVRASEGRLTASRTPLSVASPLIFGSADLLDLAAPKDAASATPARRAEPPLPRQTPWFVGRTDIVARVVSALAPRDAPGVVVIHGMAGIGKTTCLLEAVHQRAEDFDTVVWWSTTPDEGLLAFALELERVFPALGSELSGRVATADDLEPVLDHAADVLGSAPALIVLDGVEQLLDQSSGWLDPRWSTVWSKLLDRPGVGKVALTGRMPPSVAGEFESIAVPALSEAESLAMARELPRLRSLLGVDREHTGAAGADRALVTKALHHAGGHPQVIELLESAAEDPGRVASLLTELPGVDDPVARELLAWTRSIFAVIPTSARLLAAILAWTEPADRLDAVAEFIWPFLWAELASGDPPPFDDAMSPLLRYGLASRSVYQSEVFRANWHYVMHPAIAECIRSLSEQNIGPATDATLDAFWTSNAMVLRDAEENGGAPSDAVSFASLHAAPYLVRTGRWHALAIAMHLAVSRDNSERTIRLALSHLGHLPPDDSKDGFTCTTIYCNMLAHLNPEKAAQLLRKAKKAALKLGHLDAAALLDESLTEALLRLGKTNEARTLTADGTGNEVPGRWSQVYQAGTALKLAYSEGDVRGTLIRGTTLVSHMQSLPDSPDAGDPVDIWNIRETTLFIVEKAALAAQEWETALWLNKLRTTSMIKRQASDFDRACVLLDRCAPLTRRQDFTLAEEILRECRQIFERARDTTMLGLVFGTLSDLEFHRGRPAHARDHQESALRLLYLRPAPEQLCGAHMNYGKMLGLTGGDSTAVAAHYFASGILASATGDIFHLHTAQNGLRQRLRLGRRASVPRSVDDVAETVDRVPGVAFGGLVKRLSPDPASMETILGQLITEAKTTGHQIDEFFEQTAQVIVDAVRTGRAMPQFDTALETVAVDMDFGTLLVRLRRILNGETDDSVLAGLDPHDFAIIDSVLRRVRSG